MSATFQDIFLFPWQADPVGYFWVFLMGALVASTCGMLGCFLILRRNALLGDAISHAVLPGIVVAALITRQVVGPQVLIGALVAAVVCVAIIHGIYGFTRVKEDAAIGIAFTTLFAIGVIGISLFAGQVDLDLECVLYGEIEYVPLEESYHIPDALLPFSSATLQARFGSIYAEGEGLAVAPRSVLVMGIVFIASVLGLFLFYKELKVASFDPRLATTLGISPVIVHYGLMGMTSLAAVSAFNAVGAILVVAMLVVPGCTAYLLTDRLWLMLLISGALGAVYSLLGMHAALWLEISTAGTMVVVAFLIFVLAWLFAPRHGLLSKAVVSWRGIEALDPGEEPQPELP